ncbi:hypothetical protein PAMP_006628 [Pampus punctatissimus]
MMKLQVLSQQRSCPKPDYIFITANQHGADVNVASQPDEQPAQRSSPYKH